MNATIDPVVLGALVLDLAGALGREGRGLVDHLEQETVSDKVHIMYRPPSSQLGTKKTTDRPGSGSRGLANTDLSATESPDESQTARLQTPARALPANFRCNICSDRMYPVRRFMREGRLPVLVAHHTGNFKPGPVRRDQSDRFILGSMAEDDLFRRMLQAVKIKLEDFYYQEYLACHFDPERSVPADWNERGRNCLNHINDSIRRSGIRLLILTGPAAVLLLGEDKAHELAGSGEMQVMPFEAGELPALVVRSPAALLALESRRKKLKDSGNKPEYDTILAREKKIKQRILVTLRTALQQVGAG